jgi:hypothetical protein
MHSKSRIHKRQINRGENMFYKTVWTKWIRSNTGFNIFIPCATDEPLSEET